MSIRMAASCCQPLQVMALPRGARMEVGIWISVSTGIVRCYLVGPAAYNLHPLKRSCGNLMKKVPSWSAGWSSWSAFTSGNLVVTAVSPSLKSRDWCGVCRKSPQNLEPQGSKVKVLPTKHSGFCADAARWAGVFATPLVGKKTETPAVFLTVMFTGVLATPPQLSQACTTV